MPDRSVIAGVRPWILGALVATVGAAVFAAASGGPFLLDDRPLIAHNEAVHSFAHWRSWLGSDFWNVDSAMAQRMQRLSYFRPLVTATYALDWLLGSGSPLTLHLGNLGLHAAASALAFFTLRRWTGAVAPALVGGLLFAVHPSKAESVAWISGRPDVLCGVGILAAGSGMALRLRGRRCGVIIEGLGTTVAYLSKELAVVLPAFAMVEAWVALGRPPLRRALAHSLRFAAPQLLTAGCYLVARELWLPLRPFEVTGLSKWVHLELCLETLGRYALLTVWPDDLSLARATLRTGAGGPQPTPFYVALGALTLGLGAAAVWRMHRTRPAPALGCALWLATLLPVSNLLWTAQMTVVSPRFLYLPVLGIAWMIAEGLGRLEQRRAWRYGAVATGVVVVALAGRSVARTRDFQTTTGFWRYEISSNPMQPLGYDFAVEHETWRRRPIRALRVAAHGFQVSAASYSHHVVRSQLLLQALERMAALTPDLDRRRLTELERFLARLSEGEGADLEWNGAQLHVAPGAKVGRDLKRRLPELLVLRAEIATRVGRDPLARALAERAVEGCPRCPKLWDRAASVALGGGAGDRARTWYAGPQHRGPTAPSQREAALLAQVASLDHAIPATAGARRVQLQASRYLLLGLFGRAFEILRPYEAEIVASSPSASLFYARTAAMAGATGKARALLLTLRSPGEAATLLDEWQAQAGRQDAPMTSADDLGFEQLLDALLAEGAGVESR